MRPYRTSHLLRETLAATGPLLVRHAAYELGDESWKPSPDELKQAEFFWEQARLIRFILQSCPDAPLLYEKLDLAMARMGMGPARLDERPRQTAAEAARDDASHPGSKS